MQAICNFVHNHITFGYKFGRPTKTAADALLEGTGVCRDFAHLSIALCRAMNIPARYASGYLGDIGVPPSGPGDFCAWFEAFLEGRWYTFDARYNTPRIGRILMVRGRDAADGAMITSFGRYQLKLFRVWTEEVAGDPSEAALLESPRKPPGHARPDACDGGKLLTERRRRLGSTSPVPFPQNASGLARKNRTISAEASGPVGSV